MSLDSYRYKLFPPIKRGGPFDVYLSTSGQRTQKFKKISGFSCYIRANLIVHSANINLNPIRREPIGARTK